MSSDILLVLVVDLSVACLFIGSAARKLADAPTFVAILRAYRLLPAGWIGPAAVLIIGAEGVLGVAAALGLWLDSQLGLLGLAGLLLLYALAIGINIARGNTAIDCGCAFGPGTDALDWSLVLRNILIAAAACAVAVIPIHQRPLLAADWIAALGALGTAIMLYLATGYFFALGAMKRKEQ